MTREKLDEYCYLKNEIDNLEKRIEKIERQSELVADVVQNGYKGRAVIRGYDIKRKEKLHLLKEKYQERYDRCIDLKIEIENFINSISKSEIRQIFENRYYDNMNWVQIAFLMNIQYNTGRYNDETIKKKHNYSSLAKSKKMDDVMKILMERDPKK